MKIIVRTYSGVEQILKDEIERLTGKEVTIERRAVSFDGNTEDLYKVNLWSRLAIDVLVHLYSFRVRDEDDLYNKLTNFKKIQET